MDICVLINWWNFIWTAEVNNFSADAQVAWHNCEGHYHWNKYKRIANTPAFIEVVCMIELSVFLWRFSPLCKISPWIFTSLKSLARSTCTLLALKIPTFGIRKLVPIVRGQRSRDMSMWGHSTSWQKETCGQKSWRQCVAVALSILLQRLFKFKSARDV